MEYNNILHSEVKKLYYDEGSSDKIYIVDIRKCLITLKWSVYFKYGRRNTNYTMGIKIKNVSYEKALTCFKKTAKEKEKKGYRDITSMYDLNKQKHDIVTDTLNYLKNNDFIENTKFKKLEKMLESTDEESNMLACNIIDIKLEELKLEEA